MEEARRLWREGVGMLGSGFGGVGCEEPYSRSFAGVGGRLEGVSEGEEWGVVAGAVGGPRCVGIFLELEIEEGAVPGRLGDG